MPKPDRTSTNPPDRGQEFHQSNDRQSPMQAPPKNGVAPHLDAGRRTSESLEAALQMTAIFGDFAMIVISFVLATVVSRSGLVYFPAGTPAPLVVDSYKIILAIAAIVLWGMKGKGLSTYRSLLTPSSIWRKQSAALGVSMISVLAVSFVVRTDPPMPPMLIVYAMCILFPVMFIWRSALSAILRGQSVAPLLRRRVVVVGGGSQALRIKNALARNFEMEFVGWIQANKPNHLVELDEFRLGPLHELQKILRVNGVDIAVLVESESLQRQGVLAVAKACEIEHVQFKMVPHFFEVLVSGVRPEKIGEMQLLGVQCLPLDGFRNRFAKRAVDIAGALVGLAISLPIIAIFGVFIYRESPGPIFYRQIRQGRNGRLFHIIKMRTMRMDAEADGKAKWAQKNDERRLRIGTFMRKYNIDEVPQFWNVLRGHMSLVGPRPERPELIARFKSKIPHYQARHLYQPGMTGWAQVNGWRGNTCLEERIKHDMWYIENWSLGLDFTIMIRTFFHRDNAY